jgi:cellulose synthase/poly-beta-1,6-N-acetylglucosamine synthase-like glycosyltransferase
MRIKTCEMILGMVDNYIINKNYSHYVIDSDTFSHNIEITEKIPKVSFVIPTFNSERTLEECLSSISNQDYPDMEIIVVDNGSDDKTVEIAKNTPRMYILIMAN